MEWSQLNATERAEAVAEHHFRGLDERGIRKATGATLTEVRHYVDIIQMSAYKSDQMDAFFNDLQRRTMEHLAALDAQLAIVYEELDFARQRVVELDMYGNPLPELNPDTGLPMNRFSTKPRNPGSIPKLLKQASEIERQKAEVLKIVGQKSDVTVKLQLTTQVQTVILEFIQTLDPAIYAELHRQIEAIVPDASMMTIDGEFTPKALT